jgi:hypothetical protein
MSHVTKSYRRRRRTVAKSKPAVLLKREVKPIGSRAHLHYDPSTGRKLSREERKR